LWKGRERVNDRPKIKRLLLKVSGETFGSEGSSIDIGRVAEFAAELKRAREVGAEIAVVPGGGNILRGRVDFIEWRHIIETGVVESGKDISQVLFQVGKIVGNTNVIKYRRLYLGYYPEAVAMDCLALTLVTAEEVGGIKVLLY